MAPVDVMINLLGKNNGVWAIEGRKAADYLCSYGRPREAMTGDGDDDDDDDGDYDCTLAA